MKYIFIIICLVLTHTSIAQLSSSDKMKISKLLGKDFVMLPVKSSYSQFNLKSGCGVDTSLTLYEDTVGVHFRNEFLLFRSPIRYISDSEIYKIGCVNHVTVSDFREFQKYVVDSIAREKIYFGLEEDSESSRYLDYNEDFFEIDVIKENYGRFEQANRDVNREMFYFNWKYKFHYSDPTLVPILADMYLPQPQRFYGNRNLDDRKWNYHYAYLSSGNPVLKKSEFFTMPRKEVYPYLDSYVGNWVNVRSDDYSWAKESSHPHDDLAVIAQTYTRLNTELPVVGITGAQAEAFCHWKEVEFQKQFDKKKLPYRVVITLPEKQDLALLNKSVVGFKIPKHNYTDQWRITNEDYQEFVNWTKDSILREIIYQELRSNEDANKFIVVNDLFFSEGDLEYIEFDPSDRPYNRQLFHLNYKTKINFNDKEIESLNNMISRWESYKNPTYRSYYIDAWGRAQDGKFVIDWPRDHVPNWKEFHNVGFPCSQGNYGEGKCLGKTLNLCRVNRLGHGSGVRSHENFQRFIVQEIVAIKPLYLEKKTGNELPTDLIQTLHYQQALSYYRWKYPIQNVSSEDAWQRYVLPSEEEFQRIQSGGTVVIPEHELKYPTPSFRYIVHVYKN